MLVQDKNGHMNFRSIAISLHDNSNPYTKDYRIKDLFELNEDGNINSYNVGKMVVGNGIGAFMGTDQLDKEKYLFLHDFSDSDPLTKIDISTATFNIRQLQNTLLFSGSVKTKNGINQYIDEPIWLQSIINNYAHTYVFFSTNDGRALIPIQINKDGSANVFSDRLLNSNRKTDTKYSIEKISRSAIHYMPYSQGFLNHYYADNVNQEKATVEYFDKSFNPIFKTDVEGIMIQHAYESGNYIILGGYTETKGYRGYQNPRIIVLDKNTRQITYDKVIPKKNYQVDFMTTTNEGNILFSLGTPCCKTNYDTDKQLEPQVIIDSLSKSGTFANDLFSSKN